MLIRRRGSQGTFRVAQMLVSPGPCGTEAGKLVLRLQKSRTKSSGKLDPVRADDGERMTGIEPA
jgi:hypothetical protein